MNLSKWDRQIHRWLAIVFTITVVAVTVGIVVVGQEQLAAWVYLAPLLPLGLLVITGLYLFALPYAARWRRGRRV